MINFIVCDDDKRTTKEIKEVISKIMMKNSYEYKTFIYNDYDDEFMKIITSKISSKIYILDIETPSRSGIDIARLIRKKDDNSIIIFLTGHDELGMTIIKDEIMCLSFINKFDDCSQKLEKVINKSLQIIDKKKVLRFEEKSVVYTIPLEDILYITRDTVARKCIIKTDYSEFQTNKTLQELENMVDDRFVKTHRACLANNDRISVQNKKTKRIVFDNGMEINLLSDRYKKEIV